MDALQELKIEANQYGKLLRELKQKHDDLKARMEVRMAQVQTKTAIQVNQKALMYVFGLIKATVKIQSYYRGFTTRRKLANQASTQKIDNQKGQSKPLLNRALSNQELVNLISRHLKRRGMTVEMAFRCCDPSQSGKVDLLKFEDFLVEQIIVIGRSRRGQRLPQVTPVLVKRFVSLINDDRSETQITRNELFKCLVANSAPIEESACTYDIGTETLLKLAFLLRFNNIDVNDFFNIVDVDDKKSIKRRDLERFFSQMKMEFSDKEVLILMKIFDPEESGIVQEQLMRRSLRKAARNTLIEQLLQSQTVKQLLDQKINQ